MFIRLSSFDKLYEKVGWLHGKGQHFLHRFRRGFHAYHEVFTNHNQHGLYFEHGQLIPGTEPRACAKRKKCPFIVELTGRATTFHPPFRNKLFSI